jgi:hypothetical protein
MGKEPIALGVVLMAEGAAVAVWVAAPDALFLALALVGLLAVHRAGAEPRRAWNYPAVTLAVLAAIVLAVRIEAGVARGDAIPGWPFLPLPVRGDEAGELFLFRPALAALGGAAVVAAAQLLVAFASWDREAVARASVLALAIPILLAGLIGIEFLVLVSGATYVLAYGVVRRWRPAVPTL